MEAPLEGYGSGHAVWTELGIETSHPETLPEVDSARQVVQDKLAFSISVHSVQKSRQCCLLDRSSLLSFENFCLSGLVPVQVGKIRNCAV